MKKIFLICGKACAGKDTLVKGLVRNMPELEVALSFTTRPMRNGEKQGIEYDFITLDNFKNMEKNNKLAEMTSYKVANGETWYYGLTKEELEKADFTLAIVNPEGIRQIKELYGDKVVVIMITADDKDRIKRYLDRDKGNNVAECCRRYLADEQDFYGLEPDYIFSNDFIDIEEGIYNLELIIRRIMGNQILLDVRRDFDNNPMRFLGGCR